MPNHSCAEAWLSQYFSHISFLFTLTELPIVPATKLIEALRTDRVPASLSETGPAADRSDRLNEG